MGSIIDSVKPEVSDKVELLGWNDEVNDIATHIEKGAARIAFKGIKTGSKQQTANLKSLTGFNCFVIDEAEELPDLKTFKKVFYSIRSVVNRNLNILILNPTTKEHWIFEEYFEKKGLRGGENCVINNVLYIHTSYLDVDPEFIPPNIVKDYNRLKIDNPDEYDNIVNGGWIESPEGCLLPRTSLKFGDISKIPDESIVFRFSIADPADTGGDKFSIPFIHVAVIDDSLTCFVKDVIHSTAGIEANTERTLEKINEHFIEQLFYESNGVGLAAILLIKKRLSQHRKLTHFVSSINKDVRILSHFEFVKKYFVFDINYKEKDEYNRFMSDVFSYTTNSENKHRKDAIDILCSAANVLKIKYKQFLYNE
jgi:PBSX family phage terminase large subunit